MIAIGKGVWHRFVSYLSTEPFPPFLHSFCWEYLDQKDHALITGLQVCFNTSTLFHPSPPPSQGIKILVKNKPLPQNTLLFCIQTFANLLITPNLLSNTYVFRQLFIKLKVTLVQHLFSTSELHTSFFFRQCLRMFTADCGKKHFTSEKKTFSRALSEPHQKSPGDGHAGACLPQGRDHSLLLLLCVRSICCCCCCSVPGPSLHNDR